MPKKKKPTRWERVQRKQNIRTLFRQHQFWVALGTIILCAMLGWGLPMISDNFHDGILITLAGGLISIPFFLRAYQLYVNSHITREAWIILAIAIIAGVAFIATQLQFLQAKPNQPDTIVKCCIQDNTTYHVWAYNGGDDKDTVFVTLGTSGLITDVEAIMGANLPKIIEGGKNANFVTFKIDELPPHTSLDYIVDTNSPAGQPHHFTAWSEKTTSSITATFIGQCPEVGEVGPEETAPP